MSKLSEFYKSSNVPQADRMPLEKNILFVVPDKGHDISKVLQEFNLSPFEVAVTHPKQSVELLDEIAAVGAKVVLQVDCQLSRRYHAVNSTQPSTLEPHKEKIAQAIADTFVGLHHHDEFSIRDGLGTVDQLIKLLKHQRRSFCCITNHGSVGGWIKQYNACKKAGIKALFGCEFYFSDYRGDDPEIKKAHRSANHLVLIANTDEGFYNIIRIHNDAQLNGFYYTPRVNRAALERWGKGITALSACYAGAIPQALKAGDEAKAQETYEFYSKVFDKFYIELQIIELEDQREVNRKLIAFAKKVGAPMVLSLDSHYLDPDYAQTHEVLMCLRQKKTILDKKEKDDVWTFDVKNLYYRDAASVRQVFEQGFTDEQGEHAPYKDDIFTEEVFSEAMANTRKIAMGTEVITLDSKIKLPKLYDDGKEVLRKKVNAGFVARGLMKKPNKDEYLKRLKYEFDIITRTGWGDYFLVMERIVSDTREKFGEWAVGIGRGSAGGSLVSYVLRITDADPIVYDLLFERFIEEGRLAAGEPPDIDCDFSPDVRDWVKQHIVEIFGASNVCSIGTYSTYKTRAVILDVARALGESLGEVSIVTKRIEPLRAFEDEDGEEHKIDQMGFDEICEHYPELKDYFDAHPEVRRHAEILRNQVKHMGTHAGGVIISEMDLSDRIPVMYDKPSSENRKIVSAWAESGSVQELSAVGLVKYDILGLKNLPVISDCVRLIEQTTGNKIAREDIPIDDRESIFLGSKQDLVGIFQFENPVTKPIADAVGMESLTDVAVLTSLIRPGPMDADINGVRMPMEYARRKHGGEYESPEFIRKALADTYGLIVFQEQVMKISKVLSGFTAAEANKLRKASGKKLRELMLSIQNKFIAGAKPRIDAGEITLEEVKQIWTQIETFAGYGFNRSHAICYGAISTVEMWLKYHYPIQFITALINNTKLGKKKHGSSNLLVDYINYARRREMPVLNPDINLSKEEFTIEGKSIRFPLGHVKNVAKAAKIIESFQPFTGMADFYERVKVEAKVEIEEEEKPEGVVEEAESQEQGEEEAQVVEQPKKKAKKITARRPSCKVVESLIAAGAFDRFGKRNDVLAEYYLIRKKKELPEEYSEDKWQEKEAEVLGLCLSRPILYKEYEETIRKEEWYLISEIDPSKKKVMVFGQILKIDSHISKAGNSMHIVRFTDGIDVTKFFVFQGGWEFFKDTYRGEGTIAAIPLAKFDDSDGGTRFFDDRGKGVVLKS